MRSGMCENGVYRWRKIKADTPYMLENGEFVEAESDGE